MEIRQALAEYADILDDCLDWLENSYRRERVEEELQLPGQFKSAAPRPAPPGQPLQPPSAEEPRRRPSPVPSSQPAAPSARPYDPSQPAPRQPDMPPPRHTAPEAPAAPEAPEAPEAPAAPRRSIWLNSGSIPASGGLNELAEEISGCRSCNLYLLRENTVPGVGTAGATLMIITPPPADGARGNPLPPFEAEYLGKWLTALKLTPGEVFITPAVKCRTPGGRPPQKEEAAACAPYLHRQFKLVRPRAVLALGDAACGVLTGNPADFPSLVARDWTYAGVPALVLWTPAEVLANPKRLRKPVWESLQQLQAAWNALPGSPL